MADLQSGSTIPISQSYHYLETTTRGCVRSNFSHPKYKICIFIIFHMFTVVVLQMTVVLWVFTRFRRFEKTHCLNLRSTCIWLRWMMKQLVRDECFGYTAKLERILANQSYRRGECAKPLKRQSSGTSIFVPLSTGHL